jgi:hypothetical protein
MSKTEILYLGVKYEDLCNFYKLEGNTYIAMFKDKTNKYLFSEFLEIPKYEGSELMINKNIYDYVVIECTEKEYKDLFSIYDLNNYIKVEKQIEHSLKITDIIDKNEIIKYNLYKTEDDIGYFIHDLTDNIIYLLTDGFEKIQSGYINAQTLFLSHFIFNEHYNLNIKDTSCYSSENSYLYNTINFDILK